MFFLPTYKRPARLRNFVSAFVRTGATAPVLLLIQGKENAESYRDIPLPKNWEVGILEKNIGFVAAHNFALSLKPNEKWYGMLGDDLEPQTMHWDQKLISKIDDWGIVSCFDDSDRNQWRINGVLLCGGELLRKVGFFAPPCTWHLCSDDWWALVGKTFSIWKVVKDVVIKHITTENDPTLKIDDTYRSSYRDFDGQIKAYHFWLSMHGLDILENLRYALQNNNKLPKEPVEKFITSES